MCGSLALFVGLRVNIFGYMLGRCGVVHQEFSSHSPLVQAHRVYATPCSKTVPASFSISSPPVRTNTEWVHDPSDFSLEIPSDLLVTELL